MAAKAKGAAAKAEAVNVEAVVAEAVNAEPAMDEAAQLAAARAADDQLLMAPSAVELATGEKRGKFRVGAEFKRLRDRPGGAFVRVMDGQGTHVWDGARIVPKA